MRRRSALVLVLLAGALGLAAAGCGSEKTKTATPDTTQGSVPTQTTTTETTTTGGSPEGDPVAGKAVFTGSAGCTGCHTLADAGAKGTVGPNLDQMKPPYALVVDRVTNGRGAMPSFKGTLSETQIQNVAAYVSSVAGK
jgi:mono/diheme cytochrome c family protein